MHHNCKVLPGLLMLLLFAASRSQTVHGAEQKCFYARGAYRDCTCGVQYRIIEKRCCSTELCLLPTFTTENLTCPFQCQNGGIFDDVNNLCRCTDGYYGLCCHKETPSCGDVFVQHRGEFSSPNFPNLYQRQTRCVWRISTDPNRRIALGIINNDFDVEPGSNHYSCDYDSVSVMDGSDKNSRSLGRFCGNIDFTKTFRTIYSSASDLYIEFNSDHIIEKRGFRLQYSVFFQGQHCGPLSKYTLPKGTITSPQYPIRYQQGEDCEWVIKVIPGKEIILYMHDVDIPVQMDCRYEDYLLVSGVQGGTKDDFGIYCGTKEFKPYRINGEYDEIILKFHSSQSDKKQGRGFNLTYEQVELSSVSGTSSEESPNIGPELLVAITT